MSSLVAQLVKNLPAMWDTWFDPWIGKVPWRKQRLPTPIFWPGEFHGLSSPWGCRESDTTERLSCHFPDLFRLFAQSGHRRILEVSLAGGASRGLQLSQVETQRGFGWGRLLGPEGMEGEAARTVDSRLLLGSQVREGTSGSAGGDGGGALVRLRWCLAPSA